ncbi:CYTH domain-containing protein [Brevibacillus brevis]|uniref:CYTH domain-containing protein n=1 Tax=Brevibacillus brevis TaxID=1393 RepID=UPI0025A4E91C|nr:CYTH domain-containing protein [Brevibacillus brevis]WJQ81012.1 CYTH domain-containing protein [Brevibacillus brevis]
MQAIENELKLILEQESYTKFLSYFEQSSFPIHQTNYYFDTLDFALNKIGVTLRIRQENNNGWILCIKVKMDSPNAFTSSLEIEKSITELDFLSTCNNPQHILNLFSEEIPKHISKLVHSSDLRLLGSIQNHRIKLNFPDDFSCELDRSLYPGGHEFYEIEFEGINEELDCQYIIKKLQELNLNFSLNQKSKYKRFVEIIRKSNSEAVDPILMKSISSR